MSVKPAHTLWKSHPQNVNLPLSKIYIFMQEFECWMVAWLILLKRDHSHRCSLFSHNNNHIDIYAVQWGPDDNGKTVDGPGPLMQRAFLNGIEKVQISYAHWMYLWFVLWITRDLELDWIEEYQRIDPPRLWEAFSGEGWIQKWSQLDMLSCPCPCTKVMRKKQDGSLQDVRSPLILWLGLTPLLGIALWSSAMVSNTPLTLDLLFLDIYVWPISW